MTLENEENPISVDYGSMGKLLKTIVINLEESARFMNYQVEVIHHKSVDYSNKKTWRYYMNMAGLKHETNDDLIMTSLDTKEEFIITKDSLNEHPQSRFALLQNGDVFDYVNRDNNMQELYLRGVLNPLDLDYITSVDNYTVLYMDKTAYSYREDTLIPEIEKGIRAFMFRWYDSVYEFEDRYLPTILGQLYVTIAYIILNTRTMTLNTEKASTEDIKEYFRSNLAINDLVEYIDDKVMLWLYANIKEVMINTSKEKTLTEVIDNVLIPSGLNVYDINYTTPEVELSLNPNDLFNEPWRKKLKLELVPRDKNASLLDLEQLTQENYLLMETNFTNLEGETAIQEQLLTNNETLTSNGKALTKSLVVTNMSNTKDIGLDVIKIIMENWMHDSLRGFNTSYNEVDLGIDGHININAFDSVILIIYLMLKEQGLPTKIAGIDVDTVVLTDNMEAVRQFKNSRDIGVPDIIKKLIPIKAFNYSRNVEYIDYLKTVKFFHSKLNAIKASVSETINGLNIDLVKKHIFSYNGLNFISFTDDGSLFDLELYLNEKNLPFDSKTPYKIMEVLFETFTGVGLDKDKHGRDRLNTFINFLKKVISYNVQILSDSNVLETFESNRTCNIIRGLDASLILGFDMKPLNDAVPHDINIFIDKPPVFYTTSKCDLTTWGNEKYHDLTLIGDDDIIFDTEETIHELSLLPERVTPNVIPTIFTDDVIIFNQTRVSQTQYNTEGIDNGIFIDEPEFERTSDFLGTQDISEGDGVLGNNVIEIKESDFIIFDDMMDEETYSEITDYNEDTSIAFNDTVTILNEVEDANVIDEAPTMVELLYADDLVLFNNEEVLTTLTPLLATARNTLDVQDENLIFIDNVIEGINSEATEINSILEMGEDILFYDVDELSELGIISDLRMNNEIEVYEDRHIEFNSYVTELYEHSYDLTHFTNTDEVLFMDDDFDVIKDLRPITLSDEINFIDDGNVSMLDNNLVDVTSTSDGLVHFTDVDVVYFDDEALYEIYELIPNPLDNETSVQEADVIFINEWDDETTIYDNTISNELFYDETVLFYDVDIGSALT